MREYIGDRDTAEGQARRAEEAVNLDERRTGGSGSRTSPLTDGEYRREMDKLTAISAAEDREE